MYFWSLRYLCLFNLIILKSHSFLHISENILDFPVLKPLHNSCHILHSHTLQQSYIIPRIQHRYSLTISQLRFHFWGKIMNMWTEKDDQEQWLFYITLNILQATDRSYTFSSNLFVKNTNHSSRSVSVPSSCRMSCHHFYIPAL